MFKKIIFFSLALFLLIGCAAAADSSGWQKAKVGYDEFKIPPQFENPYKSDFNMYQFDEDIDVFTLRYVNPNIMSLYGYFLSKYPSKKVNVSGHDAVHFSYYDRHDERNNSILWFSAGEEFYYITWSGNVINSTIKEIVKSCSKSQYSHKEFYDILNEEYKTYKITRAIESQSHDYSTSPKGFYSIGSNGFSVGRFY